MQILMFSRDKGICHSECFFKERIEMVTLNSRSHRFWLLKNDLDFAFGAFDLGAGHSHGETLSKNSSMLLTRPKCGMHW